MSTGLECQFIESENNKWYYVLENYDAPKNAWDWLEFATAFGPFNSYKIAHSHLGNHHANPGGYSIYENKLYREFPEERRSAYEKLFRVANKI